MHAIILRCRCCLHPSPSSLCSLFFADAILLPSVAALPSTVTASTVAVLHATAAPNQSCNPLFDLPTMYANPTLKNRHPHVRPPNGIFAEEPKHPSHGGRPWPFEIRNMSISMHLNRTIFGMLIWRVCMPITNFFQWGSLDNGFVDIILRAPLF